ncbi:MAG: prolyl oligopeptidase family serine peptidase [Bifidobacterium crudilactis]|jgi:oligopeptidase B
MCLAAVSRKFRRYRPPLNSVWMTALHSRVRTAIHAIMLRNDHIISCMTERSDSQDTSKTSSGDHEEATAFTAAQSVPRAERIPKRREAGGEVFTDPYEWMRDKASERTQRYVSGQNAYFESRTSELHAFRDVLFEELKSHIKETDMSVPVRLHGFWHYTRIMEGQQYAVQCRLPVVDEQDWNPPKVDSADSTPLPGEEIVFDANKESEGHDFFRIGGMDMSTDGRWLLYGTDTTGNERYDFRIRDMRAKDETLSSGQGGAADLPEVIEQVSAGAMITPDGGWVFYVKVDDSWRPYSVWRHRVGTDSSQDVEVWTERDERFWVGVGMSFDECRIVITTGSKTTTEVLTLPVNNPTGAFEVFVPRREGVEYDVSFARFEGAGANGEDIPLALTYHNVLNPNFQVNVIDMRSHKAPYSLTEGVCVVAGSSAGCEASDAVDAGLPIDAPCRRDGNPEILQGARGLGIEGLSMHRHFVTLAYRADSLPHLAVMTKEGAAKNFLAGEAWEFAEMTAPSSSGRTSGDAAFGGNASQAMFSIGAGGNPSYLTPRMRYSLSSYTNPAQLREYDPATGEDVLLKQAEVPGDFDARRYAERRVWVRVRDGQRVPASLVWRQGSVPSLDASDERGLTDTTFVSASEGVGGCADFPAGSARLDLGNQRDTASAMFITAYGAYECSSDPFFSPARLSMLDRGVIYAVAHVRGGGEMGRAWYEQGRRLNKKHTFEDFVDVTAALQEQGIADARRTVANGGSAGGLLMGSIANMAPHLYAGIEADVPFVDALTSILDPDLPLTVTEWDEWGDPLHDRQVYDYMKSYSPYENVQDASERQERFGTTQFPKILATTSMNDTRVLYVEPLKWVARLQEPRVGADAIVKIEVEAGHGGASGRYKQWKELALENAWCLAVMGFKD